LTLSYDTVKVTSPGVYGHKLVELDADVTDLAFSR
jgi:hypothetical protein